MVDLCAWHLNVGLNRESSSQWTFIWWNHIPPTHLLMFTILAPTKTLPNTQTKNRLKNHPRGFPTWRAVGWNKQELLVGISVTLFPIESLSTPLKNVFTLNDPLPSSPLPLSEVPREPADATSCRTNIHYIIKMVDLEVLVISLGF